MRLSKDNSSWKASGIMRRDYRHTPLTPEEEVPRHRGSKSSKPRHVHKYKAVRLGDEVVVRHVYCASHGKYERHEQTRPKTIYVCEGCGHKERRYSLYF